MNFDWTISLGNILVVLGFCGSGLAFVSMMRTDLKLVGQRIGQVENRVTTIESVLEHIADALKQVAATQAMALEMDKRVDAISRRLDEFISASIKRAG